MDLSVLKPIVRLSIANPESKDNALFGPGVAALCRGVRETGSLNAAAKSMGMAYSKAWRVMKETEASLGVMLLNRNGAHGSTLTPECIQLLDAYDQLKESLQKTAEQQARQLLS